MAKDINKYAQNIARARYARPSYTAPQRRATIDPSALSGRKAATGAPLASRPIEGGPALPSPQEYNPIIDAESGEDPNAPRVETQQPIENRGSSARYMLQTGGPRLDLSFLVPERVNPAFDPNKAIGGENVPYRESKGIGGFFRRMLGDESNRMNIEAQQAQGAEWRAEAKAEKERQGRMEDYRTQRLIDKEIDDARDDKRNQHAIDMFDKSKAAQLEVLKLQNDYTKARTAEEQQNILARMGVAHNNAIALQDKALAASEKNLGLQQNFQTRLANFNAQMQGWQDANKITNMGDGFFARGGEVYGLNKGTPDIGNIKGTPPGVTPPLMGPRGEGAQVPQMDVGGAAPSMGAVTPARSALPSMLPPGDGVRLRRDVSEAVTPSDGDDVYRQNVITQPRAKATRTTTEEPPAEVPKPATATPPAASEETGEEVQGLIPAVGEYLSSGESPSLAQEAPGTAESRKGFMTALGDVGRSLSEGARSVKPLLMGGKLPRYSQDQGGNVLGMLLNAPGAILSPVEYGLNAALRNPMRAVQGVDPSTSQPVRTKLQDPNTMYMSDAEYKNYLRRQKLNNY
jgi:hypothetical protein